MGPDPNEPKSPIVQLVVGGIAHTFSTRSNTHAQMVELEEQHQPTQNSSLEWCLQYIYYAFKLKRTVPQHIVRITQGKIDERRAAAKGKGTVTAMFQRDRIESLGIISKGSKPVSLKSVVAVIDRFKLRQLLHTSQTMQLAAQAVAIYEAKDEDARNDATAMDGYQNAIATLSSLVPYAGTDPAPKGGEAPGTAPSSSIDLTGNVDDADDGDGESFDIGIVLGGRPTARPQVKRPKFDTPATAGTGATTSTGATAPGVQRRVSYASASVTPQASQPHGLRVCYPRSAPCGYLTCQACNGGPEGQHSVKVCSTYNPCGYVTCMVCGSTKPAAI